MQGLSALHMQRVGMGTAMDLKGELNVTSKSKGKLSAFDSLLLRHTYRETIFTDSEHNYGKGTIAY